MHGVKPITTEHLPTARPAELQRVKPTWLRTSSITEKSNSSSPTQTSVLQQQKSQL